MFFGVVFILYFLHLSAGSGFFVYIRRTKNKSFLPNKAFRMIDLVTSSILCFIHFCFSLTAQNSKSDII